MDQDATKFFVNAAQKLNQANKELYKPEEDIVSYLVCKNSQDAIENYLRGYLIKHEVETNHYKTIESLFQQCKIINKNFGKIKLVDLNCKAQNTENKFCNEVSKVSNCFEIANSLETLLKKEKVI
jgi:HEPN domain-containing protein